MLPLTFIVITLLSLVLFYYGTGRDNRVLLVSAAWLIVSGFVAYTGFFRDTHSTPPRFLLVLLGAVGLCFYFYRRLKSNKLSTAYLLAVHALRLPVELVLYALFLRRQVPVLMTFHGWNFDILMGISAILLLLYHLLLKKNLPRAFMLLWNITGVFFLTWIVLIAILSSPLPLQQLAFNQPNIAVLQFPYVYLPAYVVPVVLLSHLLTIHSIKLKSAVLNKELAGE